VAEAQRGDPVDSATPNFLALERRMPRLHEEAPTTADWRQQAMPMPN